ncbi:MAG: hypothetical protein ISR98_01025 [Parcubacteria group bacterium]|nr:hypothetical protein [Parcubacteria group bacterium]
MEENFNQNNSPEINMQGVSEQPQQTMNAEKKSVGPIIGIAIIVVIIIFGGLYYWGGKINNEELRQAQENTTPEEILNQQDTSVESLQVQSTSDEITDIEADLNLTDLDDLDAELGNIDIELGL